MISFSFHSFHTQYLSWSAEYRQTRTWYCTLMFICVTVSKVFQCVVLVKHDIHINYSGIGLKSQDVRSRDTPRGKI